VSAPDGEHGTSGEHAVDGAGAGEAMATAVPHASEPHASEPQTSAPPTSDARAVGSQTSTPQSSGAPLSTRTHRWGVGAYVVVEAVFLGVSLLISVVIASEGTSVATLTVALAVPTVLAAGTAILITSLRGNGPRADLGLVWSWHDIRVGLAYGFGGLFVTIPASILYVVIVGPDSASSAIGEVFAGLRAGPFTAIGLLLVVVLLAPLCEEIVYRGLLWGAVEQMRVPRWAPFVVTTLLFAVAHFEFTRTPLLLVVALPIALARLRTGRLGASVVAHQVNNLLPGVVLALALLGVAPLQ
jgi:uncharacterized protein